MSDISELTAAAATRDLDRSHRGAIRSDERAGSAPRTATSRTAATRATFATGAATSRTLLTGALGARSLLTGVLGTRHVAARAVHHVERERPEIVSSLVLVDPDRRFGALAGDAHDAATNEATRLTLSALRRGRALRSRHAAASCRRRCASAGLRRSAARLPLRVADGNRAELAVRRHRILVLLPEIAALHEYVDTRRKVVSVLRSIESNRAGVLLAAKDEFRFLFPAGEMAPGRQRHGHEDGHDGEGDEQRRHRITPSIYSTAARAATLTV
jgi:hypothetical protein